MGKYIKCAMACVLLIGSLVADIPQTPNALGVSYINAFMKNHDFAILSQGISLQYARNSQSYGSLYQLNLTHAHLTPSNERTTPQQASNIGVMAIYDFALRKSARGYHLLGLEFGLGSGFPTQQDNQFDESNFLLNLDYGYVFEFEYIALYPYARLEQYIFFPHKSGADPTDYGLNVFVGLKLMQERSVWQWWVNLGIFSDCNLSGNGVGVLGDHSIIYDRDGLSNGVLTEGGLWLIARKSFSLQARVSASYALSYYEVNLKSALVGIWHF